MRLRRPILGLQQFPSHRFALRRISDRRRRSTYAAFFAECAFFERDLPLVFPFAPLCSRLFCKTETRSITFVGFGAFLGFSSISLPPASTFSSITSMSASR